MPQSFKTAGLAKNFKLGEQDIWGKLGVNLRLSGNMHSETAGTKHVEE